VPAGWNFRHSYAELPDSLHRSVDPTPVCAPAPVVLNVPLARSLGLEPDHLASPEGTAILSGNALPPGARPLCQAYAGHQYGHFTTLGDGRAILLGEQITPDQRRVDIQLKGSGPTPYSRRGDGRAALGPMLREFLISEAMHALGIPTTRSLAVTATGETVWRESPLKGAILARVAASHLRVGTFEWPAAHGDLTASEALTGYALQRHFPGMASGSPPALTLLRAVTSRQAALIARWQLVGFVHGVMNTDNMALSGETIDYGPCAFMEHYDPATVFSSIDRHGRYAYGNQPSMAQWNLARFAEALLPLIDPDESRAIDAAKEVLAGFASEFHALWLDGLRAKLGLFTAEPQDEALARQLLDLMLSEHADFTNTFAALSDDTLAENPAFAQWLAAWSDRRSRQTQSLQESRDLMARSNPAVIPRNDSVEHALSAAHSGDMTPFERLLTICREPFRRDLATTAERQPAPQGSCYRTFCGT
jgi:uncharacterized protein YdiU (UPF0061 family)